MTKKPRPTRAEASDVANAVLDGADCVMLSGESAKGSFPVVCVETMSKLCKEAEAAVYHRQLFEELRMLTPRPVDVTRCTSIAAVEASIECMAAAIVVLTTTGRSAACISSYRPRCPIFAVTRDLSTSRYLNLSRGVCSVYYKEPKGSSWDKDLENRLLYGLKTIEDMQLIKTNQFVVFVYGAHSGPGNTNTLRIIQYAKK
jgi:pyruvate kinase